MTQAAPPRSDWLIDQPAPSTSPGKPGKGAPASGGGILNSPTNSDELDHSVTRNTRMRVTPQLNCRPNVNEKGS